MEEVLQFESTPEEASQMKTAIAGMMAEMDELREQRFPDELCFIQHVSHVDVARGIRLVLGDR